jgi:hypothetical protein
MLGDNTAQPWQREETNFTYVSNWTKIKNNHTIKWGGSAYRVRDDLLSTNVYGLRGQWTFAAGPTSLNGGPNKTGFGNQFASFMLGIPSTVGRDLALVFPALRATQLAAYFNDKWQVNPKLTANLGVRWELYPGATPQFPGGFSQYNPTTNNLVLAGIGGNPMNLGMQSRPHDFAPRVGFAYRVSDKTVVRTGFGVSFAPFEDNSYAYNYPVLQTNVFTAANSYTQALLPSGAPSTFEAGLPAPIAAAIPSNGIIPAGTGLLLSSSYKVVNTHYLDPYIESWNFTAERALPKEWILDVGYVGNHGVHIPYQDNLNAGLITGAGTAGQPLYNLFGKTASVTMYFATTTSSYNSLQATLKHRFEKGYSVAFAYTYAKAMGVGNACGENSCTPEYYVNFYRNWARVEFDRTQVFVSNYTYDLPLGPGHSLFAKGVPSAIARGWQLNGVVTVETGFPFQFNCSCSLNTPGSNIDSPNLVGAWHVLHGIGTSQHWFDTSAFAQPASNTYGNVGVYPYSGPHLFNFDAGLSRQIRVSERVGLEIRTEWYSATNTPQFGNPGGTYGSSSFGEITGTLQVGTAIQQAYGGNRIVQFGMKVRF